MKPIARPNAMSDSLPARTAADARHERVEKSFSDKTLVVDRMRSKGDEFKHD